MVVLHKAQDCEQWGGLGGIILPSVPSYVRVYHENTDLPEATSPGGLGFLTCSTSPTPTTTELILFLPHSLLSPPARSTCPAHLGVLGMCVSTLQGPGCICLRFELTGSSQGAFLYYPHG